MEKFRTPAAGIGSEVGGIGGCLVSYGGVW